MTAIDLVQQFEGCKLIAYPDKLSNNIPTIGWGHTGPDVWLGLLWTQAEADMHLALDVQDARTLALLYSPTLEGGNLEAITDFCYNCGAARYRTATLCHLMNAANWVLARLEILKWNHAGGIVRAGLTLRRQAEAKLIGA